MAVEILMPKLGLNMLEGTLVRWLVADGAAVARGQVLFEVETDKVTTDVEAETDGVLHRQVAEGMTIPVSAVVGYILAPGETLAPGAATTPAANTAPDAAAAPMEAPTTAASPSVPPGRVNASPAAKRRAQELGVDIALVPGTSKDGRVSVEDVEAFAAAQAASAPEPIHVSPLARRVAEDAGVDLTTVSGSGRDGRILRKDVEETLSGSASASATVTPIPVKGVRAVIFERMHASASQTAPVTLTTEVDATALVSVRAHINAQATNAPDQRVSYNALLVKLAARALRDFPYMNARLHDGAIWLLEDIHIGVAVDTDRGLLVPVMRHADRQTLAEVNAELLAKSERALAGKSSPDDLSGGTFTITNLGAFGIDAFTPIINLPEIAILGVGRIVEKPVAYLGGIHLRQRVVLSLTFDHRLVDGAPAAHFLQKIGQSIESVTSELMSG
jgi:pyruvate dehydrogenase E2 component (dihydrolipoamide acetyltransferase)